MSKNYYDILGVPNTIDASGLKRAYRQLAQELHPDKTSGDPAKAERFKEVAEAYKVLSDTDKRRAYDEQLALPRRKEGGFPNPGAQPSMKDFIDQMFRGDSFFSSNTPTAANYLMLPENDWGLLVALKAANASTKDGIWKVKPSNTDARKWMPKTLYLVEKKHGQISLFRKFIDWRIPADRESPIPVRDEHSPWRVAENLSATTFLGGYYLFGKGLNLLKESYRVPQNYERYISALLSLADKLNKVQKQYDIADELRIINNYASYLAKNVRIEGNSAHQNDPDREWVKKVTFDDFWARLEIAEACVTLEGAKANPEGQRPNKEG